MSSISGETEGSGVAAVQRAHENEVGGHVPGLTEQELDVARSARFDLGAGYPQFSAPEFVRVSYRDDRLEDLSLLSAPAWDHSKQRKVDADLVSAVKGILGIEDPSVPSEVRATFSGSVAVDRAIMACVAQSRSRGATTLEVITTSPSIDIMRDFLEERSDIRTAYIDCGSGDKFPALRVDALLERLKDEPREGQSQAVLLTSPENPTGECWTSDELINIAECCRDLDATLVIDHCFLVAGVQSKIPSAIWDHFDRLDNWIGIWDTGKTCGLNGDKLGFIIASEGMAPFVDDALRVLQFDVSRRQKLFFSELLRFSDYYDYLLQLRSLCEVNLDTLATKLAGSGASVLRPGAGTLALVQLPPGLHDVAVQSRLLEAGIGVVTGSSFFHGTLNRSDLIRVALARDSDEFNSACELMRNALEAMMTPEQVVD